LINNVLYVIILSAALDLVGPSVPKGVVLLADVVPSFLTKLVAPYFIHVVPYHVRIWAMAGISTCGMLLIALSPVSRDGANIGVKLLGVMLASLSSGAGELSFLGLTHYYGPFSLAFWGSGTGGAGIVGAWAYVIATTSIGLSIRTSLLSFSLLPVIMIASFFLILPRGPLRHGTLKQGDYEAINSSREGNDNEAPGEEDVSTLEADTLLRSSSRESANQPTGTWAQFRRNLSHAQTLFLP
jgi:battenin